MKMLQKMMALILVISMFMGVMVISASAVETSKDKTAQWHDESQTIADVTLSVPGEEVDVSSDIVFILGHGPAHNYGYILDMIHKMLVAADGTPTKIKIGMVGYADTTEDETVLPLTEMKDTVPNNTVAEYRLDDRYNDGRNYTETAEEYAARKAAYEAKLADMIAAEPALAEDMEYIIARALERAEDVYQGINMESSLITARDMLAADTTVPAERKHMIIISTGLTYWFDNNEGQAVSVIGTNKFGTYMHGNKYWLQARNASTNTSNGYNIPTWAQVKNDGVVDYQASWNNYWSMVEGWIEADQNSYVFNPQKTWSDFFYTNENYTEIRPNNNANYRYGYAISNPEDIALVTGAVPYFAGGANPNDDANAAHALNYERAQYESLMIYRQMQTPIGQSVTTLLKDENGENITLPGMGFNCYAVAIGKSGNTGEEDVWLSSSAIGYNFMRMMGGEGTVNYNSGDTSFFKSIENKVLYACGAGSYVEDYIGYENNENDGFNFDFLVDGKITLSVGATEYTTTKLEIPNEGATASYTFTAPNASEATFTLDYFAGNLKETEYFKWTFGEDIQNFAPVSLNYQVELVEVRMPEGATAEGYIVETNQVATLYPIGGEAEEFPVPELVVVTTYTVTYIDRDNVVQYTQYHKTGTMIPGCDKAEDYVDGNYSYTFIGWELVEGIEGAESTIGTTDLVYKAVYEAELIEEIPDPDVPLGPPQTGDASIIWMVLSVMSGTGLVLLKKREDKE